MALPPPSDPVDPAAVSASRRRDAPPITLVKGGDSAWRATPKPPGDLFEGAAWALISGLTDLAACAAAIAAGIQLSGASAPATPLALVTILIGGSILRLATRGMYGGRPSRLPLADQVLACATSATGAAVVALATAAMLGAARDEVRQVIATAVAATVLLTAGRTLLWTARRRARRRGRSGRRTLIVGAGEVGVQLAQRLRDAPELGLIPIGFVDADPLADPRFDTLPPVLGPPDELDDVVLRTGAEHVIFAFTRKPDAVVLPLLRRCQRLGIEVSVVPRLYENANERQWVEHVGGLPLVELRQTDPRSWRFHVKHGLDRAAAAVLLLAAAPLLVTIALAVRLSSPGPALFRQRRIGRDGRSFDILKFRSMHAAASVPERAVAARWAKTGTAPGGIEGTDRRTRLGVILRRTSLDELPQLINVLKGDMSLVGPRPERPEFVEMFGDALMRYDDRHLVKSGITGWAQVHGLRGQTSLGERIHWDNWYIQNWSLWLDVRILLLTPLAVLRTAESAEPAPLTAAADAGDSDGDGDGPDDRPRTAGPWPAS